MKRYFLIAMICFASLSHNSFCEGVPINEWTAYSGISGYLSSGNSAKFNTIDQMPLLSSRDNLFINANRFTIVRFKMKLDKSYTSGRIFFKRIGDRDFNYSNSVEFQGGLNNIQHAYIVNMGRNPNWFGVVNQLMFNPINSEGQIDIKDLSVLEPNTWLLMQSVWREFIVFEVPQLRTVNFIYGPKVNGLSVNFYIYCLIAVFSLFVIVIEILKCRNARKAFPEITKKIVLACIILWIALDLRILFDNTRTMLLDWQIFHGKSLQEKRAMTTLGDFYDFVAFSDSKIPKGSSFNIIHPGYYYFSEKANYYLYPTHLDDNPEYVLVYNTNRTLDGQIKGYFNKGYKIFSTFKEGEFILKK